MKKRKLNVHEALLRIERKKRRRTFVLVAWILSSFLGIFGMKHAGDHFRDYPKDIPKEDIMDYFVDNLYLFGASFSLFILAPILLAGRMPTKEELAFLDDKNRVEPVDADNPVSPPENSKNQQDD